MKTKNEHEIRMVLLLLAGILLMVLSVFFFTRLDMVVHGDLYRYGLQFNSEWAEQYWTYSRLFGYSLAVAMLVTGVSIVFILIQARTRGSYYRFLVCALLVFGIFMIGFAGFFFNRLDLVVHGDLYRYGLQFSYEWAERYWSYSRLLLALVGVVIAINAGVIVFLLFKGKSKKIAHSPRSERIYFPKNVSRALTSITFRNIPRQKLRNALTVLAIVVGVALIIGVNVTFDSVLRQFEDTARKATGNVDIAISSLQDAPFNESVLAEVKAIDGVVAASARLSSSATLEGEGEIATIIGVDSRSDFDYSELNITRRLESTTQAIELDVNGTDAVVAEDLNYNVGDTLGVYVIKQPGQLEEGELPNLDPQEIVRFSVVGVYYRQALGGGGRSVYIDLVKAQEIYGCRGEVNTIIVKIAEVELTDKVVNEINSKLGSAYVVNPIKKDLLEAIEEPTSGLALGLQVTSTIALCVSIIVVLNTMYMNVGERTREIGILRSIGASNRQVFWVFFSQSLILGAVGAAIGVASGIILTSVFKYITNQLFFSPQDFEIVQLSAFKLGHIAVGAGAGVLAAIIGGVFPSIAACRIDVIKALRPTMRKSGKPRTALKLIAIGLPLSFFGVYEFMGGALFGGVSWEILIFSLFAPTIGILSLTAGLLRIANPILEHLLFLFKGNSKVISRNIDRNLLRSTACFTMIGLSLSFMVVIGGAQTGVVTGIEEVIKSFATSDLTIISEMNVSRSFADNITNVGDGTLISDTTPIFIVPQETILMNNLSLVKTLVTTIVIDPSTYLDVMSMKFSKDTPSDVFVELNESGSIILTAPLALSLNVTVNDEIEMPIVSIVQVPVTIPDPNYNYTIPSTPTYNGTIPNTQTYNGTIPITPAYNTTIPTITIYVPQTKITYVNFTVIGIAEGAWLRSMSFNGIQLSKTCYMSYSSLNEFFPEYTNEATLFFAKANLNQDLNRIKDRIIESYGTENKLTVLTRNEILNTVNAEIDKIFLTLYTNVLFAVVNAAIGVMCIMIMNVSMRRREIGILRSQGMSKSQVVTCIIGEAFVLGVVGFIIGVVLGLIFQSISVRLMNLTGFIIPFTISFGSIMLSFALALLTSVISAAYPSHRASTLDIVESLRQ